MEINCTKHNLITEEIIFKAEGETEVNTAVTLPVGKQLARVLKCSLKASVTATPIYDKTVTVEGPVALSVICLDTENRLFSLSKTVTFSKAFESEVPLVGSEVTSCIEDEKLTADPTDSGKIDLRGSFALSVTLRKPTPEGVICDIDGKNVEQQIKSSGITSPIGRGEKNLIAEEEISVGNGQPSVDCVIRSRADSVIEETGIVGNKVMIKGIFKIYVLYLPEEGTRPQSFEESYPFSQLIEVDGITENCRVSAESRVVFCELTPRPDIDGDLRTFTANLKLIVSVKAYCDEELPLVTDAFSTVGGLELTTKELSFSHIKENVNERFIARKELEFTDGAIGSVIDMWCESKGNSCRFEEGQFKIAGTILINLLAYDCEGVPNCYERPVDFEYVRPISPTDLPLSADYRCTVMNSSYTITGANTVSVAVEPTVEATILENRKLTLITDAVPTSEKAPSDSSSIILYFADAGEDIWDIAKRYNSSISEIKELNGVAEDILPEPKKFLIPTK